MQDRKATKKSPYSYLQNLRFAAWVQQLSLLIGDNDNCPVVSPGREEGFRYSPEAHFKFGAGNPRTELMGFDVAARDGERDWVDMRCL